MAVVRGMARAAPHRGSAIESLVLGRIALAIANDDRTDAVLAIDGSLAVAFVGSLDNARALRAELTPPDGPPPDDTVVAIVAAAYRAFGDDFTARLRGVFAGVVTDGDRLVAFRDHLGYRPLFYRVAGAEAFVASEAKQVVAGAGIAREPDLDVVGRIFHNRTDDDMPSALRGVERLPKASVLVVTDGQARRIRYWDPASLLETTRLSPLDLQTRFDELMTQAVSRALTGPDVVSLSGGIDSPAIAAYAAPLHLERYGTPLEALTVVYPRYPSVDERRYVEPLAETLGLPLHLYEQETNALADVERWVVLTDGPYRSAALAQYAEDYERARALGFRTVLSGEHAEFVVGMQWSQIEHYATHGRIRPLLRELRLRHSAGRSWWSIARLLARSLAPDRVMDARRALQRNRVSTTPAWVDRRGISPEETVPVRERWRRLQLTAFIGPGISLEAEEVCQAVTGVRSRKPWTDIDLWELFLRLPADQKFPDLRSKSLVRDLLRGRVPDFILDRQDKTVFDEAGLANVDLGRLRRHLSDPAIRIAGVDYRELQRRLDSGNLGTIDYGWARSLATVHAFLAQWES